MKIIWSGIGITNARGKIGAQVATRNRGGAVMREYVVPVDANTGAQATHRMEFAAVLDLWQSLDQDERNEWARAAEFVTKRNTVGNNYKLTGAIYFQQCNMNALLTGVGNIILPSPFAKAIPLSKISVDSLTTSSMVVSVTPANGLSVIPYPQSIIMYAGDIRNATVNYQTNAYRFLFPVLDGSSFSSIDLYSPWLGIFPSLTVGKKIFFRCKSVNQVSGIASPWVQCSAIIS